MVCGCQAILLNEDVMIVEPILVLGCAVTQYFRCDLKSDVLCPDPCSLSIGTGRRTVGWMQFFSCSWMSSDRSLITSRFLRLMAWWRRGRVNRTDRTDRSSQWLDQHPVPHIARVTCTSDMSRWRYLLCCSLGLICWLTKWTDENM